MSDGDDDAIHMEFELGLDTAAALWLFVCHSHCKKNEKSTTPVVD